MPKSAYNPPVGANGDAMEWRNPASLYDDINNHKATVDRQGKDQVQRMLYTVQVEQRSTMAVNP